MEPHAAPDLAIVLLARARAFAHIGVWLLPERKLLHADTTTRLTGLAVLRAEGWQKMQFYAPV